MSASPSLSSLPVEPVDLGILRAIVAAKRRSIDIHLPEDRQKLQQIVSSTGRDSHNSQRNSYSNNNNNNSGSDTEETYNSKLRDLVHRKSSMISLAASDNNSNNNMNTGVSSNYSPPSPLSSTTPFASFQLSPSASPLNLAAHPGSAASWAIYAPSSANLIFLHLESRLGVQLGSSSRYGSFKYQDHLGATYLCSASGPPLVSELGFVNVSQSHLIKSPPGRFADFRIQVAHLGYLIQHKDSDGLLKLTPTSIIFREAVLASSNPNALPSPTLTAAASPGFRDRNRAIIRGNRPLLNPLKNNNNGNNNSPGKSPPPPPVDYPPLPSPSRRGLGLTPPTIITSSTSYSFSSPPSPSSRKESPLTALRTLAASSSSSSASSSPSSPPCRCSCSFSSPSASAYSCSNSSSTSSAASSRTPSPNVRGSGLAHVEAASTSELLRELTLMRDRIKARSLAEGGGTVPTHRRGDSEVPRMLQRLHSEVSDAEPSAKLMATMETLQELLKTKHEDEANNLKRLMEDQVSLQRLKAAEAKTREETAHIEKMLEGRGQPTRSASFSHGSRSRTPTAVGSSRVRSGSVTTRFVRAKGPVDDMFRVVTATRRGCFQFGCDNRGRMRELVWHPTKLDGKGVENSPKDELEEELAVALEALQSSQQSKRVLRPEWVSVKFADRWGELMTAKEWKQQSEQPYSVGAADLMKLTSQWHLLLAEWPKSGGGTASKKQMKKLKTLAYRGIPDQLRGQVWFHFSGAAEKMENNRKVYEELSRLRAEEFIEIQLRKDITRTYPNHVMFRNDDAQNHNSSGNGQEGKYSEGQMLLFRVLRCLALRNPSVGYCQGMGFSCALFLMYMPEEAAFWTMNQVLLADRYNHVANLYIDGFPLLFQAFHILERLMRKFVPKLCVHFEEASLTTMTYATKWFQMVYAEFPRELVVLIWDVFLCEGWRILYRMAIAILLLKERELLAANPMELLELVHDLPKDPIFGDTQAVMATILKVDVTAKELKKLEMEYGAELAARGELPLGLAPFSAPASTAPAFTAPSAATSIAAASSTASLSPRLVPSSPSASSPSSSASFAYSSSSSASSSASASSVSSAASAEVSSSDSAPTTPTSPSSTTTFHTAPAATEPHAIAVPHPPPRTTNNTNNINNTNTNTTTHAIAPPHPPPRTTTTTTAATTAIPAFTTETHISAALANATNTHGAHSSTAPTTNNNTQAPPTTTTTTTLSPPPTPPFSGGRTAKTPPPPPPRLHLSPLKA